MTPPSDTADTEVQAAADEIEILLQRAAPGSIEKAEVVSETGLGTDEVRAGVAHLEEQGRARETDYGELTWAGDGDNPASDDDDSALIRENDLTGRLADLHADGPALSGQVRSTFEIVCSFGRAPGDSDNSAILKTQAIAEEIGNALGAAMPRLDFHVDVRRVDTFDSPRTLWPVAPADEDESRADGS